MSKTDDLPEQDTEENFSQNYVAVAYGPRWSDQELLAGLEEQLREASIMGAMVVLWKLRKMPLKEMHAFYRSLEHLDAYEIEKLAKEIWGKKGK
jgi:hypothetical protein